MPAGKGQRTDDEIPPTFSRCAAGAATQRPVTMKRRRSVPAVAPGEPLRGLQSYLRAAGYRPLPDHAWPPGAIGAFANAEGDRVVVVRNRFECLELRPLDSGCTTPAEPGPI
jgi:hypothetical protein